MEDYKKIVLEAQKALDLIKNGEIYTSSYVISRFEKAADENPSDQLIGNMRDVIVKRASSNMFFSQSEISELYKTMYGISGGHTAFRDELGDLLPESAQLAKVAYTSSNIRKMEEVPLEPIYKNSDLSDAFSVLFSMGKDSSFASFKEADAKSVQKVVISKLAALGRSPVSVDVLAQNEHFALASAVYQNRNHEQLSIYIPVQMSNGQPIEPSLMVQGTETVDLNKDNLYIYLKEASHYKKASARANFAGDTGTTQPKIEPVVLPKTLESLANFDTDLIKVATNFTPEQVYMGVNMLTTEISSYTNVKPQIKVASSDKNHILFNAKLPASPVPVTIDIPVEYHNKHPILPSRFAANIASGYDMIYDFSQSGFNKLYEQVKDNSSEYNKIARLNSPMGEMSYHQLVDQVIDGVATKDYNKAEDALGVIEARFGEELHIKAMSQYANLLKHSSAVSTSRGDLIKKAQASGQLITVPTTVELYSPKLGLPVSKIDFDNEGNMYPKGRVPKYDNQNDEVQVISSHKIYLS